MPFVRGTLFALLAACAFGLTTPFVKRFGAGEGAAGPFATAALLYSGAAVVTAFARRPSTLHRADARWTGEGALAWEHMPRLLVVAAFGAVAGPVALAWGLQRTSALAGSLLLNLEAVFTVLLGRVIAREHFGRRVGAAVALM